MNTLSARMVVVLSTMGLLLAHSPAQAGVSRTAPVARTQAQSKVPTSLETLPAWTQPYQQEALRMVQDGMGATAGDACTSAQQLTHLSNLFMQMALNATQTYTRMASSDESEMLAAAFETAAVTQAAYNTTLVGVRDIQEDGVEDTGQMTLAAEELIPEAANMQAGYLLAYYFGWCLTGDNGESARAEGAAGSNAAFIPLTWGMVNTLAAAYAEDFAIPYAEECAASAQ